MTRLVARAARAERDHIAGRRLSILDWGCALGDGLDPLRHAFPASAIVGQDISLEAITRARRAYPQHEFVVGDEIRCDFDVIVVSNCLEHFADPLRLVEKQLAACRKLYVALVPFEESPLYDGHAFPLRPRHVSAAARLAGRALRCGRSRWSRATGWGAVAGDLWLAVLPG